MSIKCLPKSPIFWRKRIQFGNISKHGFLFAIYRAAQSLLSDTSGETTGMEGPCVICKIN